MENFRNYPNAEIHLDENSGVLFIFGGNGSGKTTLLNAINWCLYGNIIFQGVDQTKVVRPNWAQEGDETTVSMIIQEDDRRYVLRRSTNGLFDDVGTLTAREISGSGNSSDLSNYERDSIVTRLLPENIKNLFFLSENFSNEILGHKSTNSLKANIYRVSELDTIESAITHLGLARSDYLKNISKATKNYDKIQRLNDDIDYANRMIKENKVEIEKANEKIAEHKTAIQKLEKILKNSKETQELKKDEEFIKDQLKDVDEGIEKDEADIVDCLQKNYPRALLMDGIAEYRLALIKARDAGRIPAPINPKIIQQSKEDHVCACCGKPVDDEALKFMDEQQKRYEEIDKFKFLADGISQFATMQNEIEEARYILIDAIKSQNDKEHRREEIKKKLSEVRAKLDEISDPNLPDNPEKRLEELERKIEKWEIRRREYAQNITDFEQKLRTWNTDVKRLISSAGGNVDELQEDLATIERLEELLKTLQEKAENTIRERIREGVWQSFKQILDDTQFTKIKLDKDYIFSFCDKDNYRYDIANLCVGEAKTLALALVSTLSNDIGYSDTPLFIDNLFDGIEPAHFHEVTKCIESLSDKKQIFITYLYSEKTDEGLRISNNFNPAIIKRQFGAYKDPETGKCNLKEY